MEDAIVASVQGDNLVGVDLTGGGRDGCGKTVMGANIGKVTGWKSVCIRGLWLWQEGSIGSECLFGVLVLASLIQMGFDHGNHIGRMFDYSFASEEQEIG